MNKTVPFTNWFWYLMGIAALLLFFRLGAAPIYILDEAKNAQCAREMWHAGNWVYPTFNGELRTDKPALHYWFMMVSFSLFGEGAGQARFFSALLGLGVIWITFMQVRRHAGDAIGFFSVLALILSPHFLFEFRLSVPDPYLIFFTTAGLFSGYQYLHHKCRKSLLYCGIFLGLAVLAKGPVALALPGFVFFVYIIIYKKWWVFKDPFLLLALIVSLAIAFPWYYAVHLQSDGAFTKGFFLDHNLNRFSAEKEGHGGPFIITPLIVLIGMLPFSIFLFMAFKRKFAFWSNPFFRFSAIVVLVYVVFFSISSTKLPNYPMPCYPFVAVLIGFILKEMFEKNIKLPTYFWIVWISISIAIPIVAFFGLRAEPAVAKLDWVAFLLILLPVGTLWAFKFRTANNGLYKIGFTWLVFSMVFLCIGYPLIYRENPVTKLLPLLQKNQMARVVVYKNYNPGFNFNLKAEKMILQQYQDIQTLLSETQRPELNREGADLYVITRLDYKDEFTQTGFTEIARQRDLFELPTTIILKWTP